MAVSGLMGYDVPDWLANWLLERQNAAKNSSYYLNQPSPVATGAYRLFDEIGQSITGDPSGQEGPGGTPAPQGINFAGLTLNELANVARFGFENEQNQKMAKVSSTLLGLTPVAPLFSALQALGIAVNKAGAEEYAREVPLNFQEVEDEEGLKALQELESTLKSLKDDEFFGLFSSLGTMDTGLPVGYGKENYSQEMIDEALEQGLDPFGPPTGEEGVSGVMGGSFGSGGHPGETDGEPSSSPSADSSPSAPSEGADPDGPGAGGGL